MACNFIKGQSGEVIDVRLDNGVPSQLFRAAQEEFQNRQKAIDAVAITKSADFIENVNFQGEEPSLEVVKDYLVRQNANQGALTAIQMQDLKNSLMSVEVSSIEELTRGLQNAFYSDELFSPTDSSLANSGLYTPYEAQTILSDIPLQEKIKSSIEALNNTDYEDGQFEEYFDIQSEPQKTEEFNSFGKLSVINPYVVEKAVINAVAAPETESDFYGALADLEYNSPITYEQAQSYIRAEEWKDVDGEISPALNTETALQISLTKTAETTNTVVNDVNSLLSTPDFVLNQNEDKAITILKSIEQGLAAEGLDVIGISQRANDTELKPFLYALQQFLINPTLENTNSFAESYDAFFEKDTTLKSRPLKESNKNRNYVYLNSSKSEEELFANNSILKVKENTYIKVRRQPLDVLYQTVYSYNTNYSTLQAFQTYVQQQSAQLENIQDGDLAEEITLMKMYFEVPMVVPQNINVSEQSINEYNFTGNREYLTTDFVSDFYAESLKQKLKNTDQYKNFYSNFGVNEKGVYLINDDPITVDTVNTWLGSINKKIAGNLTQYSLISKQLPTLGEVDTEQITAKEAARSLAINYPMSISKINSENFRVDENNLIGKNSQAEFIRVGMETYENIETKGDLTLYVKLPLNNSDYNIYKTPQPKTNVSLQDYGYLENAPEKWMTEKNYLNKTEKEKINSDNFNC